MSTFTSGYRPLRRFSTTCSPFRCTFLLVALGLALLLLNGIALDDRSTIDGLYLRETKMVGINGQPILSILTSVYQGDEFLEGFLEDITKQTIFSQCELLLAQNDAPSANAAKIIQSYLNRFSNIKLINMKRTDLYTVWNTLIEVHVTGKYITNANIADRKRADSLEVQVSFLEDNDMYDLVATGVRISNKPNIRFNDCRYCPEWYPMKKQKEIHLLDMLQYNSEGNIFPKNISHNAPVWRASIHSCQGGFRQEYSPYSDYEFWLRALTSSHRMILLPVVTNLYLINEESYGRTLPAKESTSGVAATDRSLEGLIERYSSKEPSVRKLNILIVYERIPGHEGGDRRLWSVVEHLHGLGHKLYFIFRMENTGETRDTEFKLRAMRYTYTTGDMNLSSLPQLLQDVRIDMSILPVWFWFFSDSWFGRSPKPTIPELAMPVLTEKSPKTRVIIYTDDIHHVRMASSPGVGCNKRCIELVAQHEIEIYQKAETLMTITREDADAIRHLIGKSARTVIDVLPYTEPVIHNAADRLPFDQRSGVIYIGTHHAGNIQAVTYILEKVWPELQKRNPTLTLTLVGADAWRELAIKASQTTGVSNINTFGKVKEPLDLLRTSLVFLNPVVLGGTGVSTKNFFSMAHSVPVVTNSKGVYGLCKNDCEAVKIAEDPMAMVDAVMDIIGTREKWENASENAFNHAVRNFGPDQLGSDNALTVAIRELTAK